MNILPVIFHFLVEIFPSRVRAIFFRSRLIYKYCTRYTFLEPRSTMSRVWPMGNEDIYRYRAHIQCSRTMGVQNDEKPTHRFRGEIRETAIRGQVPAKQVSCRRGLSWGICEAFCKINIVGQPEHDRAQARIFFRRLLSRMLPHFLHIVWSQVWVIASFPGRRGGRDVVGHRDSRRFLTFSIREYILSSHTTGQSTAENYPSKLVQRSIARFTIS